VLLQQFLHLAVSLSDQYLAGRFTPPDGSDRAAYLAALTTAHYLYWFVSSYTVVVSVGATALVSRLVGAGDYPLATRATAQGVLLALGFGGLASAAGLLGLPALIRALQLEGDAARYAVEYLRPIAWLLAFQILESGGIACLVGAGDTRTGLRVLGTVAVLNLPLAWILCFGIGPWPGIGFVGIALGTAISHLIGAIAVVLVLLRGRYGIRLVPAQLAPDWTLLRRMLRVSLPAGFDSLSVGVCQLWFLGIVNQLGDVASSAHGIALRWEALGYLSGGAFGAAGRRSLSAAA
jgi:Na+-driven multidrug efflux pump